jgi:hypothetical protein
MMTLNYTININATPEKVWKSLWDSENYKKWTKPFTEGSYYQTDNFSQGNKIHFLSPNGDGMYSTIDSMKENEYMAFKHWGEIKNFKEMPITDETKSWSGSMETYTLNKTANGTEVIVTADASEQYADFMNKAFPAALQEVKKISETK